MNSPVLPPRSAERTVIAPAPLRLREAVPGSGVWMRSRIPFALPRDKFEAAARACIDGIDALRLRPAHAPGARAPLLVIGEPPGVNIAWGPASSRVRPLDAIEPWVARAEARHRIEIGVEPHASGEASMTIHACGRYLDRRSLEIVTDRILGLVTGSASLDPADRGSYVAVAEWLQELLDSVEGSRGRLHWRRVMSRADLGASMPDSFESRTDAEMQWPMPPRFAQLPREDRESLAAACWLELARAVTRNGRLPLGVLSDGREEDGLSDVVGPLSRFIPLVASARGSVQQTIRSVREELAEARTFQEFFLLDAVADDRPQLDYFPYCFEYVPEPVPGAFQIEGDETDCDRYRMLLRCQPEQGTIRATIRSWHPDVSARDLQAMIERWFEFVERSLESPTARFGEPDLLLARERAAEPLRGGSRPLEGTLHEAFDRACQRFGDRIAISCLGEELSLAQLDSLSERLAALLPHLSAEEVVAIEGDPSPAVFAAILATLKLGGVFLPVSPAQPAARRQSLLQQAGARIVLATTPRTDAVAGCRVLDLNAAMGAIGAAPVSRRMRSPVHPDQLACLLATSGTTGAPRLVGLSHRALLNLCLGLGDIVPQLQVPRRVAIAGTTGRDALVRAIGQLLLGHTLVLGPAEAQADGLAYRTHLSAEQVEVLDLTPSQCVALELAGSQPIGLNGTLVLSGEAIPEHVRLTQTGRSCCNIYTLAECGGATLAGPVDATTPATPVTRALCNTAVFVADRRLRPVRGIAGEVVVSGEGLGRGYVGDAKLTAERFIPNPAGCGVRAVRTGDLAVRTDAGIEFSDVAPVAGSADRGAPLHRIKAVLETLAGVAAAVVAGRRLPDGAAGVVAWIVPSRRARNDASGLPEIEAALAERLGPSAPPTRVLWLERMPLTDHGRVDREALDALLAEAVGAWERPLTPLEERLLTEWRQILEREGAAVEKNFFDDGADSFAIMRLNLRLRSLCGVEVPLVDMFKYSSIRLLAQHLATLRPHAGDAGPGSRSGI